MSPDILLTIYCGLIILASLAGGWLPSVMRLTHIRMQLTMSFVAGLMLGVALLQMMPHAAELVSFRAVGGSALAGVVVMFFMLRWFHVHHYQDVPDDEDRSCPAGLSPKDEHSHDHDHDHDHDHSTHDHDHDHDHSTHDHDHDHSTHDHDHDHDHSTHDHDRSTHTHDHSGHNHRHSHGSHQLTWTGLLLGLAIHTLLDGVALGAAISASHGATWAGLGTFLAIALHKPMDALSITSAMQAGGWPTATRTMVNISFAAMCPLGAVMLRLGVGDISDNAWMVGCALGFSAGFLVCIALGDLLPEVAFHTHDRVKLSVAMLCGVALAVGVEWTHHWTHVSHPHASPAVHAPITPGAPTAAIARTSPPS